MLPNPGELNAIIDRALAEDSAGADVTTSALIVPRLEARATLVAHEPGVLAGLLVSPVGLSLVSLSGAFGVV